MAEADDIGENSKLPAEDKIQESQVKPSFPRCFFYLYIYINKKSYVFYKLTQVYAKFTAMFSPMESRELYFGRV